MIESYILVIEPVQTPQSQDKPDFIISNNILFIML